MQRSWESCWQGWPVLRIAGGVVVNPLVYKKIGPTFYYIRKVVRFYYCFFSRNKNLVRQTKYRGPFFVYKHINPTVCMKKKKNRNDFCINIKLEKSLYFKKSVRFCMNDFRYMLELHKYYIFVQGKTKMTLKLRPKKIGSTFCIIQKIGIINLMYIQKIGPIFCI